MRLPHRLQAHYIQIFCVLNVHQKYTIQRTKTIWSSNAAKIRYRFHALLPLPQSWMKLNLILFSCKWACTITLFLNIVAMLETYGMSNPNTLLLFLESLPQHFDVPSGSFDEFKANNNHTKFQCFPLNSTFIQKDLKLGDESISIVWV